MKLSSKKCIAIFALMWRLGNTLDSPFKDFEKDPAFWRQGAHQNLHETLKQHTVNNEPAKNVIIFIGDGMDVSTMTAGRILKGQMDGKSGEETRTAMDGFPNVGMSKVYTINSQTPDSAGTGTAIHTGVKAKSRMIGLNGNADESNCLSSIGNEIKTILEHSADEGKATGVITTTYITHATPATTYAHVPSRSWKTDADLPPEAKLHGCKDIGAQLIDQGRKINVVLGGGRAYMRPKGYKDEEYGYSSPHNVGRNDDRNLIDEWLKLSPAVNARYVWNKADFDRIRPQNVDHLFGLFEPENMRFEHDRKNDVAGEPSLAEMTEKAIKILRKKDKGYFLMVEGGKIDHGHHATKANLALSEFVALDNAVEVATRMTDSDDTLIIVTADHGHMFNIGGYSVRGNPVSGFAEDHENPKRALDGSRYTSIAYGNGAEWLGGKRRILTSRTKTDDKDFRFPATIPIPETHSASDVAVLARGPMSHVFSGIYEQNYIGYAMMYASCVGPDKRHCASQNKYHTWDCSQYKESKNLKKKSFSAQIRRLKLSKSSIPWWCRDESSIDEATEQPETENTRPTSRTNKARNIQRKNSQLSTKAKSYGTRRPQSTKKSVKPTYTTSSSRTTQDTYNWRLVTAPTTPPRRVRATTPRRYIKKYRPTTSTPYRESMTPKSPVNRGQNRRQMTTTRKPRQVSNTTPKPRSVKTSSSKTRSNKRREENNSAKTRSSINKPKSTSDYPENVRSRQPQKFRRQTTATPRRNPTPSPSSKSNKKRVSSKKSINRSPNKKSNTARQNLVKKRLYQSTHRVSRREVSTTPSTGEESSERTETQQSTITDQSLGEKSTTMEPPVKQPKTSIRNPRDRFLDQIAYAVRRQLQHMTVSSETNEPASLDLSLKVNAMRNKDSGEKKKESTTANESNATVICMKWSSDSGMINLANSSKYAFLYEKPSPEKQVNVKSATSGGNNTAAIAIPVLLAVVFFVVALALLYQLRKKNELLKDLIEEQERERKAVANYNLRLEDVQESDLVREQNVNNNSSGIFKPGTGDRENISTIGQWVGEENERTPPVWKSRKISPSSFQ